ncbi:MAG: PEGA domain-containing protein [Proteobacteria bacterium]|nr:PEGA domain-containing protein [Pseudomonadota bacterium]
MRFDHLIIKDVSGERRVAAASLPLRVGTGSDCELRLPGPGGGPIVLLDLLDGAPFVQPVGRDSSLQLNGEPLLSSRRLENADQLEFFGSRIRVLATDGRLVLEVRLEDSAYVTRPPELADAETTTTEETIAPTAFQRASKTQASIVVARHSPLKTIVGGGFAVLLIASYLLFSARSIQFDVDPESPDDIDIAGGWFRLPLGDRVLLRRGEYTANVRKQGYYDVSQAFTVGDEPSMRIVLSMRRLPGRLAVTTEPFVDAAVSIDNGPIGKVPYGPTELQPGQHSISVQADRFLPFNDVIEIAGLDREELLTVQLVPRWSEVSLTSDPAGASIYVGDAELGVTPATIQLLEGTHQISVLLAGFAAWDGVVTAIPNVAQTLPPIALQPANARLQVTTIPRAANVTVDGRYRGQSPITLALSPGVDYVIGLSKAGYGSASRKVRLAAAASDSITVDLSARTGRVTVNVSPADAVIYVDGAARSQGSVTLDLSSAPHTIVVKKDGHESWSRSVTPRPGYPQTLTAHLRSLQEIERAKIQLTQKTASEQILRRIEPGTFTMGSSRADPGRRANEVLVPVTISRPYLISVREVSNKEFSQFRANHDSGSDIHAAMSGDANPVAQVTWADAAEYCNWLSAIEGLQPSYEQKFGQWAAIRPLTNGYRLPTEAEWVWAIRYSGTVTAPRFAWGPSMPPKNSSGNFADRSASDLVPTIIPRFDDGFAATAPTGLFTASPIGIYDGSGNVAEWVNDFYSVPTPGLKTPLRDPLGPEQGQTYVIRGSSWRHAGETELRLSYRDYGNEARSDVGFRIARNLD